MRRRIAAVITISTLVVLLAAPAAFAAQARISQPSDTVRERTDIRVEITRDSRAEPISGAQIRLRHGGETRGDWVRMTCRDRCGDGDLEQVWAPADDRRFDPATGAPFTSGGPLRNGEYQLEVQVERGRFLDPVRSTREVRLAVPPSAPGEVTAERDGKKVQVSWKKAPEPDVTGYRVERRSGNGWNALATTSETGHVDEPEPGSYGYRVVTLRDDGRGGTLETPSSEREVEIPEPETSDNGDSDGDGNGDGNGGSGNGDSDGDGNGNGGSSGNGDDTDRQEASTTEEDAPESSDDSGSSERRERRSTSQAPSLGSESGGIPSIFGRDPATADPDAYSEELDYGSNGNGDADDDVVLSTGRDGTFDRMLDGERVATPIAVGLVLMTTGLHLWRWLRVPAL